MGMKKISYDGCQLLSVATYGMKYLNDLFQQERVKVWTKSTHFSEILVGADASEQVADTLGSNGVPFRILFDNLQDVIQNEYEMQVKTISRIRKEGKVLPWKAYFRLPDIYKFLDLLAAKYPKRVEIVTLGWTYECREVRVLVIRSGFPSSKKIWIDGGIHGREWITSAVVLYIAHELVVNRNKGQSEVSSKFDFYVAPLLNPDGYEYSHTVDRLWRNNRNITTNPVGVDMNRSFGRRGSKFVDKEVRQIETFIRRNKRDMIAFISYHNYSQMVLYPFGTEIVTYPEDYDDLVKVGEAIAASMKSVNNKEYKAIEIKKYAPVGINGNSVDWARSEGILYTFGIELGPANSEEYPGFLVPNEAILPMAKEAFAGIQKMMATLSGMN